MSKEVIFLLRYIDYSYNKGRLFFDIKKTVKLTKMCKLLRKEGIISAYIINFNNIKNTYMVRIYLNDFNYVFKSLVSSIKPYTGISFKKHKSSKNNFVSYGYLRSNFSVNIIHLLSCDSGFLTCKEALIRRKGGILICRILL